MDITGMDIAAVATLVGSIGTAATAVVKAEDVMIRYTLPSAGCSARLPKRNCAE